MEALHKNMDFLNSRLNYIMESPKDKGLLKMIVRRPDIDQREEIEEGQLSKEYGLVGDSWIRRGSSKTEDGRSHPDMQINIMNARCIEVLAGDKNRWKLAGDQLFIDLDLSNENLPPETMLGIGDAVLMITSIPHNGCKKFAERFGLDAVKFVNSKVGKQFHLRGLNAKVVKEGKIKTGDQVRIIA